MRQEIIRRYAPLVKYVIGRMALGTLGILDADDIISHGTIGLINAVDRFDPSRGVKFETYAIQRIRGSIVDAIRGTGLVSRSTIAKARMIDRAVAVLQQDLQRNPTSEEVAGYLNMAIGDYHKMVEECSYTLLSLESVLHSSDGDEPTHLHELLADEDSPDPASEAERDELRDALLKAVRGLAEREKLVINLYYVEELTLREISKIMNISESRVHQLHTRAILRLRGALTGVGMLEKLPLRSLKVRKAAV